MKPLALLFCLAIGACPHQGAAQVIVHYRRHPAHPAPAVHHPAVTNLPPVNHDAETIAQVHYYQKLFVPTDPRRILHGTTNYAKGSEWFQFEGRVLQVTTAGILLDGWFAEPLAYELPASPPANRRFLLQKYPHSVSPGQVLSRAQSLVAHHGESAGAIPHLDYGLVWTGVPVLTAAEAADARTEREAKVLAYQQELAAKGDLYGQYKMGMRYLKGDGVPRDLARARALLESAAAQGSPSAIAALKDLDEPP